MKNALKFYELTKPERIELTALIKKQIVHDLRIKQNKNTVSYFDNEDTYIRKSAYLNAGQIYFESKELQTVIIKLLEALMTNVSYKIRQTAINAAGEIGKSDFNAVEHIFDRGLFDEHHSPRNAVIGSLKKMGEVNPVPVLKWAQKYLHHPEKEIRREICHGLELRGRKYPLDILPLLKQLQDDKAHRVRSTLIHVIGQISYKKGCLETVVEHLKSWENKQLVNEALEEIIDVHNRYRNFFALTQKEAKEYIYRNFKHLKIL